MVALDIIELVFGRCFCETIGCDDDIFLTEDADCFRLPTSSYFYFCIYYCSLIVCEKTTSFLSNYTTCPDEFSCFEVDFLVCKSFSAAYLISAFLDKVAYGRPLDDDGVPELTFKILFWGVNCD